MIEITAGQVKALRDRTGAGMMDCKTALTEAGGDMEAAVDILRKRGLAQAAKRAGRRRRGPHRLPGGSDGRTGVLVEVNCETDFVAKTDDFKALVAQITGLVAAAGDGAGLASSPTPPARWRGASPPRRPRPVRTSWRPASCASRAAASWAATCTSAARSACS